MAGWGAAASRVSVARVRAARWAYRRHVLSRRGALRHWSVWAAIAYGAVRVLTLRDVVEGDLLAFFEHQRDPEANAMAAFPARDRKAFELLYRLAAKPPR